MKTNWPVKKLGEVAICQDGDWILSKDLETGNDVRLIQLGDIGEGKFLNKTSKYISKDRCEHLKCTLLKSGDILLARLGEPLGKACIFPEFPYPCITAVDVTIIRPNKLIDSNFLHNYLNSKIFKDHVNSLSSGATRKRISRKNLENLEIPVPGIEEQRRIVKKLEKILAKIEETRTLRQELIEEKNLLFRTVLGKVFSKKENWEQSCIKDVSKKIITGSTPSTKDESYFNGKTKWVTPGDFDGNKWVSTSRRYVSDKAIKEKKVRIVPKNSIMLVAIGATVGKLGMAIEEMATNQQINSIIFSQNILPDFGYYYLLNKQDEIFSIASASTLPIINKTKTGELEFNYPESLREQEEIVEHLDSLSEKVQALQKLQQEQLQDLDALQQSVLHQAFQEKFI